MYNPKCPICKSRIIHRDKGETLCNICINADQGKLIAKVDKLIEGVSEILISQAKFDLYKNQFAKMKSTIGNIRHYSRYNVTELLVQLEFNRLGWKIDYQRGDGDARYVYDFFIRQAKIVIEIDEKYHKSAVQTAKDKIRDEYIKKNHKGIIRVPEQVIRGNINNITTLVLHSIVNSHVGKPYFLFKKMMDEIGIEEQLYKFKFMKANNGISHLDLEV